MTNVHLCGNVCSRVVREQLPDRRLRLADGAFTQFTKTTQPHAGAQPQSFRKHGPDTTGKSLISLYFKFHFFIVVRSHIVFLF